MYNLFYFNVGAVIQWMGSVMLSKTCFLSYEVSPYLSYDL